MREGARGWKNRQSGRGKPCYFQTFRLSDFQTFRLSDFQTFRLSDFQTFRLSDFQTFRLSDFQTFRLSVGRQISVFVQHFYIERKTYFDSILHGVSWNVFKLHKTLRRNYLNFNRDLKNRKQLSTLFYILFFSVVWLTWSRCFFN